MSLFFKDRHFLPFVACCLLTCLCLPATMMGQAVSTGTVTGLVTDPSHAAIPGAKVTLTDTATGVTQATVTNDTGRYIFVGVQPGDYNVTVSKESFRTVKVSTQNVKVGSALTLDVQMEIGSAAQTIEVVAAGTELQTLNATIGNTVTAASLDALPTKPLKPSPW